MTDNKQISELSDIQSEAGVIATLISNPEFILYSDQLTPRHFYNILNGCVYWGISELYKSNITNIDAFNLLNVINTNKAVRRQLGDNLNQDSINDFLNLSKNVARKSIEEYNKLVSIVLNYAFKRKMVESLNTATNLCFEDNDGVELYKATQSKLEDITAEYVETGMQLFSQKAKLIWEESREKLQRGETVGYTPFISELGNYFQYSSGELILYAGKAKQGKSLFALNEAVNLLRQGVGVLYIDTELRDDLFLFRLISHLAKVPFNRVKNGNYDEESQRRIDLALKWIDKQNFYHYFLPGCSQEQLFITAKTHRLKCNTEFIIYDHVKSSQSKDSSAAYYELGSRVGFLKDQICGTLQYGGICLAQLNRSNDIGESFKIVQEVSAAVWLNKKSTEEFMQYGKECGNGKITVKYNRLGQQVNDDDSDFVDVDFDGNFCSYRNVVQHQNNSEEVFG